MQVSTGVVEKNLNVFFHVSLLLNLVNCLLLFM